jgi:hypothetical protein
MSVLIGCSPSVSAQCGRGTRFALYKGTPDHASGDGCSSYQLSAQYAAILTSKSDLTKITSLWDAGFDNFCKFTLDTMACSIYRGSASHRLLTILSGAAPAMLRVENSTKIFVYLQQ